MKLCSIDGCDRKHEANGLCELHDRRRRKGIDMHAPIRVADPSRICSVDGCSRRHRRNGMCDAHAKRMRKGQRTDRPIAMVDTSPRVCAIEGCGREHDGKGLCKPHGHQRRKYGLTVAELCSVLKTNGGMCAICSRRPGTGIDHDHATGTVRGLLCNNCNAGLGMFGDNADVMIRAIDYVKRFAGRVEAA